MIIFTAVWSDEYINYFEKGLVNSFRWPRNAAALAQAHWIICCPRTVDQEQITRIVAGITASVEFVNLELYEGVKFAVRKAHKTRQTFLMAPPDNVFSDGSITNFQQVCGQPGVCVASAHVRVLPSYLNDSGSISAPMDMVTHAWKHLHGSWTNSWQKSGESAAWHGGVFYQKFSPRMIAVQHRLPTIFLSNITAEDVDFFNGQPCLGVWDNIWPPVNLISQQRYRYLGSSEAGFIVEITHPGRNVPAMHPVNPDEPDAFYGNALHNWINREFVSIFQASEDVF